MLFDTRPQTTAFLTYAGNWLKDIFGGGGNADSSFADSVADGSAAANGTAQTDGTNTVGGDNVLGGTAQGTEDAVTGEPVQMTPGETNETTASAAAGAASPGQSEPSADGKETESGDMQDADGTAETGSSAEADQSTQSGVPGETGAGAAAAPDSGTEAALVYVPGEGVLSDGAVLYDDSRVGYVSGEGLYVDSVLTYAVVSGADGGLTLTPVGGDKAQKLSLLEQVLGGRVIVYDAASDGYSVQDTAVLVDGTGLPASQGDPVQEADSGETQQPSGESGFQVARGLNRRLTGSEKDGTVLLCAIIAAAAAVLLFLYGRYLRGKRRR